MSKVGFLAGVGLGYVLGAKAGRRRYEQIKARADKVWQSPTVQHKVNDATQVVKDKAPELQHKVTEAARDASSAVKAKVSGSHGADEPARRSGRVRPGRAGDHGPVHLSHPGPPPSVSGAGRRCPRLASVVGKLCCA